MSQCSTTSRIPSMAAVQFSKGGAVLEKKLGDISAANLGGGLNCLFPYRSRSIDMMH